jgi:hypothetical protein
VQLMGRTNRKNYIALDSYQTINCASPICQNTLTFRPVLDFTDWLRTPALLARAFEVPLPVAEIKIKELRLA